MTISRNPEDDIQQAEWEVLTGDPELTALVTGVWDEVPEDAARPYVRIGDRLSIPDNDHGGFGREITETVHVWTEGRGNREGQRIVARVVALLDHQPAALNQRLATMDSPHRVISVRHEFGQQLRDPDPTVRHAVARFRIITTQEES